jgi:hypothetical protein
MKRGDTPRHAQPVDADRKYNPVFNRRNERMRGLWERNAVFYAQVNVRGWIGRVPLHEAKTLPEAPAARQVLKAEIKAGKWKTPAGRGRFPRRRWWDEHIQPEHTALSQHWILPA